jgi:hypothetical protein
MRPPVADSCSVDAACSQIIGYVFKHGLVGKRGVILEHYADAAFVDRFARDVLLIEKEASGIGFDTPSCGAEKGSLSTFVWSEQRKELAVGNREIDASG